MYSIWGLFPDTRDDSSSNGSSSGDFCFFLMNPNTSPFPFLNARKPHPALERASEEYLLDIPRRMQQTIENVET